MAKPQGLQKRKQGYYIRVRVPADLVGSFGKNEILRSLKTQDYKQACRRVSEERVLINRMFDDKRTMLTHVNCKTALSSLSQSQKLAFAIEWIRNYEDKRQFSDAQHIWSNYEWEEIRDTLRIDEGNVFHALIENRWYICQDTVEEILNQNNISYQKNSPEFIALCRLFLEALGEVTTKALLRHERKPVPKAIDEKFLQHNPAPIVIEKKSDMTLEQLSNEYCKNKGEAWPAKRQLDYQTTFLIMYEFLGKNKRIQDVTRQDCRFLSEKIKGFPANLRKTYPASSYSLSKAYELGQKAGMRPISIATYNGYMSKFSTLMKYALEETYISQNPASGLMEKDRIRAKEKRFSFSKDQLHSIFNAPLYTGCVDADNGHNCTPSAQVGQVRVNC